MIDPAGGIEEFFRGRYGREALYLPSGRLALYLAFREWLRPGDRLLMSPVNDDVVFFTVLAAGLLPVLGPVDPATGNLDPTAVDERVWTGLKGVMTTNLYGISDRMDLLEERCRRHGLLLLEDACQALDSRFGGRRIGQISDVAAFSLTKHIDGVGGVLCFPDQARRARLARRAETEIRGRSVGRKARDGARLLVRAAADRTGTRGALARLRRRLRPAGGERDGHRMPYDPAQVFQAREAGGGLDRFDRWVRVDNRAYRTTPFAQQVGATLARLERFEDNRRLRLEGARKLLSLGLAAALPGSARDDALFRVPLFVRQREQVLAAFAGRGLELDYIYDPPLDLYAAPGLAERIVSPEAARVWSRDVLPVDPLRADQFLSVMKAVPGILSHSEESTG